MDKKDLILLAKEVHPERFSQMQEEIQETIKELVQPIEGGDKAHTTHEKIAAKLEQDLTQAEALAAKRKELLEEVKQLLDVIYAEDIISSGDLGKVYEKVAKELGDE